MWYIYQKIKVFYLLILIVDDFDAFKTKFLIITKFWFRSIIKRLRTGSSDTRIDAKCVYRIIEQNLLINSAA